MIVRTGRWARRDAKGPWAVQQGLAGLHMSCADGCTPAMSRCWAATARRMCCRHRWKASQPIHTLVHCRDGHADFRQSGSGAGRDGKRRSASVGNSWSRPRPPPCRAHRFRAQSDRDLLGRCELASCPYLSDNSSIISHLLRKWCASYRRCSIIQSSGWDA